jgi:hypothetical protein
MSAGTTAVTKSLDRAVAQAKTITGIGSARVYQGYKRWAEADNFEAQVRALTPLTQGYFSVWIDEITGGGKLGKQSFRLAGELAVTYTVESSVDLNSVWDLASALLDALQDQTVYVAGEHAPRWTVRLRTLDPVNKPGIIYFDWTGEGVYP